MDDRELRQLQLKELDILKEVKRICEKHNITYYLSSGTCLGAVRHNGFIPWDDDVDVMMPYNSYTHFLDIAPQELGKDFFLQNFLTDSHDYQGFTKIRMNDTAMILPNHTKWKVHQGIWIDIFPVVYLKDYREFEKKKRLLSISNYLQMDSYFLDNEKEFKQKLKAGYFLFRALLKTPLSFRQFLHKRLLTFIYSNRGGEQFFSEAWGTMSNLYPISVLEGEPAYHIFEDDNYPLVPGYEKYLSETYGDYMSFPPESERKAHGNLVIDFQKSYKDVLRTIGYN